jgi:hypothetical protein
MLRATMITAIAVAAILVAVLTTQRLTGDTEPDAGPDIKPPSRDPRPTQRSPTAPQVIAETPTPDDPEEQERERQRQRAIREKNPELLPVCREEDISNHPTEYKPSPESVWDAVECKSPPSEPHERHRGPRGGSARFQTPGP